MYRSAHTQYRVMSKRIASQCAMAVLLWANVLVSLAAESMAIQMTTRDPVRAVPQHHDQAAVLVQLGEKLFFEKRLEPHGQLACVNCHNPAKGGGDNEPFSMKADGHRHVTNTPSLFNVRYNQVYYWSGQSFDLANQLDDAIRDLGTNWTQVVNMLEDLPEYSIPFRKVFIDGVTTANVKKVLIAFEKSLITPNARFDKFLIGNNNVLTEQEQLGYQSFKVYGCIACHQGINLGGNLLVQTNRPLPDANGIARQQTKPGAYDMIRVPGLRNVEYTAPYFHDGSQSTLEQAINQRSHNGLLAPLPAQDLQNIVLFLRTLTGEYQGRML